MRHSARFWQYKKEQKYPCIPILRFGGERQSNTQIDVKLQLWKVPWRRIILCYEHLESERSEKVVLRSATEWRSGGWVTQRNTRGTVHAKTSFPPSLGVPGLTLAASRDNRELMSSVLFVSRTILSSVLTTGNLFFLHQVMPLFSKPGFPIKQGFILLLYCILSRYRCTEGVPSLQAPLFFLFLCFSAQACIKPLAPFLELQLSPLAGSRVSGRGSTLFSHLLAGWWETAHIISLCPACLISKTCFITLST